MIYIMKNGGHDTYNIKQFTLDTPDDLPNLPTSGIAVGSAALVISTSDVYMLNSKGEWDLIASDAEGILPSYSAEDAGKILEVGEGGILAWAANNALPSVTSEDEGKVLKVDDQGEWVAAIDSNTQYTAGANIQISEENVISATDTTYSDATTEASGLMSATDKTKLNGIANNANNYTLPAATVNDLGGVKVGTNLAIDANGVLSATDTKYTAGSGITITGTSISADSQLPTVTSADKSKVLAVNNQGSWAAQEQDTIITKSVSGDLVSFSDGADAPLVDCQVHIEAVQSGSGDPSPTNVRPISGFNAVNVGDISDTEKVQYFKGLLDGTYGFVDLGSLDWSLFTETSTTKVFMARFMLAKVASNTQTPNILTVDYTATNSNSASTGNTDKVISISTGGYLRICDSAYNNATAFKAAMNGVYLIYELATPTTPTITPTEYNTLVSAFGLQGWFVQIAMPDEAGTVYGGTLDVLRGKLIVTHSNIASYDGETINEPWISSMDKYVAGATPTTGAQVIYPLTTPVTYQLTPTEIRSLLGMNNVWADCGAITELKYIRDLNLCINDIIARIEALESGSNTRSLSISPTLTKSIVSDSDTAEGKTEETEEETKEEAQNER